VFVAGGRLFWVEVFLSLFFLLVYFSAYVVVPWYAWFRMPVLVFSAYVEVLAVPSVVISLVGRRYRGFLEECVGLPGCGRLIGYVERSLIYVILLVMFLEGEFSMVGVVGLLSIILAGKAIFRFSAGTDRKCADWYLFGTFTSITLGLVISMATLRPLGGV